MATISKRKSGYQAQICVNGRREARNFATKGEARLWASMREAELESGIASMAATLTVSELLERFEKEEKPYMQKIYFMHHWTHGDFGEKRISDVKPEDLTLYIKENFSQISPISLKRYASALSSVFSWAVKRKWLKSSPFSGLELPKAFKRRERIASEEEVKALQELVEWHPGELPVTVEQRVVAAFLLSVETGMRGGEILQIERPWWSGAVVKLPDGTTKTGKGRNVALNAKARQILSDVERLGIPGKIFSLNGQQRRRTFTKLARAIGAGAVLDSAGREIKEGLHFHDARATFCTRAAGKIDVLSLARQVGHSDTKMLMRYYRPTAEEIAEKL